MRTAWRSAWRDPAFRLAMIITACAAVAIAVGVPLFFHHIATKPGVFPPEPLLNAFAPIDVTWLTFAVLYGGIAFTLRRTLRFPYRIVRGLHAYALLQGLRMVCMEAWTLEPPPLIIPLVDPVTAVFYPGGLPFLKDLFFSGHTATLAIMFCLSQGTAARWYMFLATVAVAGLVLVQHVHWTVDVLAAPVFTWIAWRLSALTLRACGVAAA